MENNNSPYTLITGGSEGIGKALALECARRGMNVLLVALPGDTLSETAAIIQKNYQVKVDTLAIDLTEKEAPEKVYAWCKKMKYEVNILINNAGMAGTAVFEESTPDYSDNRILLNIRALVLMCRLFIPGLKKFDHAYILNISSLSAFFSIPYKSVYSASKTFVLNFSKAIRYELKDTPIQISIVCPNGVVTNPGTYARTRAHGFAGRLTTVPVEKLAAYTMNRMLRGRKLIIPGRFNYFLLFLQKILPEFLKMKILLHEFKKEVAVS